MLSLTAADCYDLDGRGMTSAEKTMDITDASRVCSARVVSPGDGAPRSGSRMDSNEQERRQLSDRRTRRRPSEARRHNERRVQHEAHRKW